MSDKIYDKTLQSELLSAEQAATKGARAVPASAEFIKNFAREVLQLIKIGLLREGIVRIHQFGTFRLKMAAQRKGYNPHTREKITIPARARVVFTPAKALREAVEGEHKPSTPIAAPTKTASTAPTVTPVVTPAEIPAAAAPTPKPDQPATVTEQSTESAAPTEKKVATPPKPPVTDQPIAIKTPLTGKPQKAEDQAKQHTQAQAEHTPESQSDDNAAIEDALPHAAHIAGMQKSSASETSSLESTTATGKAPRSERASNQNNETSPKTTLQTRTTTTETSSARLQINEPSTKSSFVKVPTPDTTDNEASSAPVITVKKHAPRPAAEEAALLQTPANKNHWPLIAGITVFAILLLLWLIPFKQSSVTTPAADIASTAPAETDTAIEPVTPVEDIQPVTEIEAPTTALAVTETENITPATEAEPALETIATTAEVPATPSYYFSRRDYTVNTGDNFWKLSRRFYINPFFWTHIYRENHSLFPNPNIIDINAQIILPTLEGSPTQISNNDRRSIAEGYFLMYQHYKKVGFKNAHYALIGVKWFDANVLKAHESEIDIIDQRRLNAKRKDNQLIRSAMSNSLGTVGEE